MSKVFTLKDCCSFQEGYVNPSQKISSYFGGGIKWLRASDLNGAYVYNTERTLSDSGYKSAGKSAKMFAKDTIAISKSGTIGAIGILKKEMCGNRAVINIAVDGKKADLKYVFYTLKYKKAELVSKAGGSIQKNLYVSALETLPLNHSLLKEQVKISSVLSAIDAKIELNNRINTELETMAKTLYDYWFVQFDFPDANGKPYKTSGGKMAYNPVLKREIPEGWIGSNILTVADLLGGGTPTKNKPEYWNGSIPFFTPTDSDKRVFTLATEHYITKAGLKNSSTRLFDKNTVFITARGSVGRLALNAVPMAMNQSCYALRVKEGISYVFLFYLTKELIYHLKVKASGSVFNSIVSNDIEYTNLAIPQDINLIEEFAEKVEPIFETIELLMRENQQLSSLRDWLLPMLMNGQVTVK
ncbi:restriction endonuclease subunit S [Xenorhabdus sp. 18]|uniref:restriction endonuclease subunit S n=1 Tax=Xenorhabdus doucetiae TaxID=351671 RepID=UPI0019B14C2E|nr:restriction endonuclease subunit S [Xenorhabdus sp. 18]MBD2795766.1 restriction endonuclease subunit S [Xenorhabdus sp. 18]